MYLWHTRAHRKNCLAETRVFAASSCWW